MPRFRKILKSVGVVVGTLVLMVIVYYGEQTGQWLKTTLLLPPQPWNGATYPIQKIPNWTRVGAKIETSFNHLNAEDLIDLPAYDLSVLSFPTEDLVWDDPAHEPIRNAKITYPVVYMGNYEMDHREQRGSHLAVDIKVPMGTPVHAMANGQVVQTSANNAGFGHYVVIRHPDAPNPDAPNETETIYSVYSHMSDVYVTEGQNVEKGFLVGRSGKTGTATTPHLHFQIDRESAPWHPYWPFTWAEAAGSGLSFFEAVNAGLGKNRGREHTLNPLKYVQDHFSPAYLAAAGPDDHHAASDHGSDPAGNDDGTSHSSEPKEESRSKPQPQPEEEAPVPVPPPANVEESDPADLLEFKITGEHFGLLGTSVNLYIEDQKNQIKDLGPDQKIRVRVQGSAKTDKKVLKPDDFENRTARLIVRNSGLGHSWITVGKSAHDVTFIEQAKPLAQLMIETDGRFVQGVPEEIWIRAADEKGNPTPAANFMGDIALKAKKGRARFKPDTLQSGRFASGVATVVMTALSEEPLVIRAQNGALLGESRELRAEKGDLFSDIRPNHPNFQAIKFLKENGIISGYPDGTFKPGRTVNRVEALKMLMLAFEVNVDGNGTITFKDTGVNEWYASTLAAAVQKGIVKGYPDGSFKPAQTVNRAEYLKILFKSGDLEATRPSGKPYRDVPADSWFAPYAFLANRKNVMPVSGDLLEPVKGMTRAEVAETIYRLKLIQLNGWVAYNE